MDVLNRAGPASVALETTLLAHGVPRSHAAELARELARLVRDAGATPALVGVLEGRPVVGLTEDELDALLAVDDVPKANAANLGILMHRRSHAATTVSATMELAAAAGVRLFATGGIGGVHRGYGERLDVSSDLAALARYPVAVVTSGVKSLLDVEATREALETLGVPVIGHATDSFPAFYRRQSEAGVDARVDDPDELAALIGSELARTGRGLVIANPIPAEHEIEAGAWERWCDQALGMARASGRRGRDVTPSVLAALHDISAGQTLEANMALVRDNTRLAARLAARLG